MGEILAKFFGIARRDCCNYVAVGPWGKANYCLVLGSCVLKEDRFCQWFNDAVIAYKPYRDAGLLAQWQELWQEAPTKILNRMCRVCGDEFRQTSPRQVFCVKCRVLNRTEKKQGI